MQPSVVSRIHIFCYLYVTIAAYVRGEVFNLAPFLRNNALNLSHYKRSGESMTYQASLISSSDDELSLQYVLNVHVLCFAQNHFPWRIYYYRYHKGRILSRPIAVNIVFTGSGWPESRKRIVKDFVKSLTFKNKEANSIYKVCFFPITSTIFGSLVFCQKKNYLPQWWGTNCQYWDKSGNYVSKNIRLGTEAHFPRVSNNIKGLNDLQRLLISSFSSSKIVPLSSSFNVILTGPEVKVAGFCQKWCGLHSSFKYNGKDIVFAVIGNAEKQCLHKCSPFSVSLFFSLLCAISKL